MRFKRLIPLGSWCRVAYQCRTHSQVLGLEPVQSGPFDWTITPFRTASRILYKDFREDLLLNPVDSYVNRVGSVTCGYTGISFHHDLAPEIVSAHGGTVNDQSVPVALAKSDHWINAKSRFMHTLENMMNLSRQEGNLYVRWMNCGRGRSDDNFPEVFDGETPSKLATLLSSFDSHQSFCLLHVTSEIVPGVREPLNNPIKSLNVSNGNCIEVVLLERLGHNGDQTYNYIGDEASWRLLFEAILLLNPAHGLQT